MVQTAMTEKYLVFRLRRIVSRLVLHSGIQNGITTKFHLGYTPDSNSHSMTQYENISIAATMHKLARCKQQPNKVDQYHISLALFLQLLL